MPLFKRGELIRGWRQICQRAFCVVFGLWKFLCVPVGVLYESVCWGGGNMKGWHPTHMNVTTQVMVGAYDQIFMSFLYYCSCQTHTPANTFLWMLKRVGMAERLGFVEGIVSTLFKRVRKGAHLAKKNTGLFVLPKESTGVKRHSLMERNNC